MTDEEEHARALDPAIRFGVTMATYRRVLLDAEKAGTDAAARVAGMWARTIERMMTQSGLDLDGLPPGMMPNLRAAIQATRVEDELEKIVDEQRG
jgi:NAD(P)H-dependent flavin oxidoreductase YrpB (nitropropane dioxygenase family)